MLLAQRIAIPVGLAITAAGILVALVGIFCATLPVQFAVLASGTVDDTVARPPQAIVVYVEYCQFASALLVLAGVSMMSLCPGCLLWRRR
jgi:hypothetical protein